MNPAPLLRCIKEGASLSATPAATSATGRRPMASTTHGTGLPHAGQRTAYAGPASASTFNSKACRHHVHVPMQKHLSRYSNSSNTHRAYASCTIGSKSRLLLEAAVPAHHVCYLPLPPARPLGSSPTRQMYSRHCQQLQQQPQQQQTSTH
jgi:hypothetical protein